MNATHVSQTVSAPLPDRLLTTAETADLLGVSVRWVYRQVHAGELPAMRIAGSIRFDPTDLANWLVAQRTRT